MSAQRIHLAAWRPSSLTKLTQQVPVWSAMATTVPTLSQSRGADPSADVQVLAVEAGPGEPFGFVGGVVVAGPHQLSGDVADAAVSCPQDVERGGAGEVGDLGEVGSLAGGELFGVGALEGGEQVAFGVVGGFAGEPDAAGVVAFDECGGVAAGGVDPRAPPGAGHGDVDGLPVQAVGADDEHLVTGDALGLVDRDGVAVVEVPGA